MNCVISVATIFFNDNCNTVYSFMIVYQDRKLRAAGRQKHSSFQVHSMLRWCYSTVVSSTQLGPDLVIRSMQAASCTHMQPY